MKKSLLFRFHVHMRHGRYDLEYEEKGIDYPIGYVRWTERRNFDAVLYMMSIGLLNIEKLISHRFHISEGEVAMQLLSGNVPVMGVLLDFSQKNEHSQIERSVQLNKNSRSIAVSHDCEVGFLGAGNYAGRVLMPAFKAAGANLNVVASSGGVSAIHFGRKFKFREATTDSNLLFTNNDIDTVVVATRHNAHANQVLKALDCNKHVFCEKPLCLTLDELKNIQSKSNSVPSKILMVGFNRRFSPHVQKIKSLLGAVNEPKSIIITVNAGKIPSNHWIQDLEVGGGRMVGEGCHFIDLARYLIGYRISSFQVQSIGRTYDLEISPDKFTVNLAFEDGSFASINYLANGHKSFPKERVEIFTSGRVLQLDNFLILKGWGWAKFNSMRLWRQNKGQVECVNEFVRAVKGLAPVPIPKEEIFEISRISIEIAEVSKELSLILYKLGLIWRTVRHLKLTQIFGRVWFKFYKPRINTLTAPISREFNGLSVSPAKRPCSMTGSFEWSFLNEKGKLSEIGWQRILHERSFRRYNQHYFDDLNSTGVKGAHRAS